MIQSRKKVIYTFITIMLITLFYFIVIDGTSFLKMKSEKNEGFTKNLINNSKFIPRSDNGISYGILDDKNITPIDQRHFKIAEGDTFEANIVIANNNSNKLKFLLLPLINYENKNINIGTLEKNKFEVELESKQYTTFKVRLTDLKNGINDFTLLIINDPNTNNLSLNYRKRTEMNHTVGVRVSIEVGKVEAVKVISEADTSFIKEEVIDNNILSGMLLSDTDELKQWVVQKIPEDKKLNYKIHVGNQETPHFSYAILALLDWKQIDVIKGEKVVFGNLPLNKRVIINGTLNNLNTKDVSNFTTILIPFPFEHVERFKPMDIEASARVGIY